jgi:hypothetical protein
MNNGNRIKHYQLLQNAHEDIKGFNMIVDSLLQKEKIEVIIERSKNYKSTKFYQIYYYNGGNIATVCYR